MSVAAAFQTAGQLSHLPMPYPNRRVFDPLLRKISPISKLHPGWFHSGFSKPLWRFASKISDGTVLQRWTHDVGSKQRYTSGTRASSPSSCLCVLLSVFNKTSLSWVHWLMMVSQGVEQSAVALIKHTQHSLASSHLMWHRLRQQQGCGSNAVEWIHIDGHYDIGWMRQ